MKGDEKWNKRKSKRRNYQNLIKTNRIGSNRIDSQYSDRKKKKTVYLNANGQLIVTISDIKLFEFSNELLSQRKWRMSMLRKREENEPIQKRMMMKM